MTIKEKYNLNNKKVKKEEVKATEKSGDVLDELLIRLKDIRKEFNEIQKLVTKEIEKKSNTELQK